MHLDVSLLPLPQIAQRYHIHTRKTHKIVPFTESQSLYLVN